MLFAKLMNTLKRYFISGMLVVVPLILTYIVLKFLFESIDGILQPLIHRVFGYWVYGLGVVTTLLLILLAGVISRNYFGSKLYKVGDYFLSRVPLIRPIYSAAKQLMEALTRPNMNSFKEVVMVEYPRKNVFALGFLSNRLTYQNETAEKKLFSVFIPSTPTPVSGMVILFEKEEIYPINMTVEEGVKFLVSGGVASPEILKHKNLDFKQGIDEANSETG